MTRRAFVQALAAPLVAGAPAVRVETDGMLSVGGARTFVLGLYQLPRHASPWKEVRRAGFNLVHANPDELRAAGDHGLYAWLTVGSISPAKRAADQKRIRRVVTAARNHSALLFWETEDEPTFVWKKTDIRVPPQQIIETARFVRSLDPVRPLYLNHSPTNLESTLRAYNPGAELIATDIYPVVPRGIRELYGLWPDGLQGDLLNTYISQVGQYADKMRRVAGSGRAVFMVLQAFAWETLRKQDHQDPAMILYPTRAETRFMAYQSVVHGANGVIWWGLSYAPPDAPIWGDLKAVAGELAALKEELAAPATAVKLNLEYHDTGHSLDRGIEWVVKPGHNSYVLITVNADRNPVEVSFGGLDRFRSCTALFETRQVRFSDGRLHEAFGPFDVRVYRLGSHSA